MNKRKKKYNKINTLTKIQQFKFKLGEYHNLYLVRRILEIMIIITIT